MKSEYYLAVPLVMNNNTDKVEAEIHTVLISRREDGLLEGRCSELSLYEFGESWDILKEKIDNKFMEVIKNA